MKKSFLIIIILLISTICYADWYVFNSDNRAIAKTKYEPDVKDLSARNEFAVQSDSVLELQDAEYFNGKIRQRVKSQEEKNKETQAKAEEEELKKVYHRMFKLAVEDAVKDGEEFTALDKHISKEELKEIKEKINTK